MDPGSSTRDGKGRFQPGNPGGPGRPRGRQSELRRAVEDAGTPELLAGIMRRVMRMALEGNLTAAKIALDRGCGKVSEAAASCDPIGVELPKLHTIEDCNKALDTLITSICAGSIDSDKGKLLVEAVQVRMKGIETQEMEKRLAALEESVSVVELPRRRRA